MKTQKTAELIKAATIARCISKEGKCLGYAVKSNSGNAYYHVTASKVAGQWHYFCTCKAGANAFRNCKDGKCCHVKAVLEVVEARKAREQEAAPTASYDVVAEAVEVVEAAEIAALRAAAISAAAGITPEQLAELLPYAQEYAQHKPDVEAQKQAELDSYRLRPNYETVSYCQCCGKLSKREVCYRCQTGAY